MQMDWITATSYDYNFYKFWAKEVRDWEGEKKEAKLMQYLGMEVEAKGGTIRLMVGTQRDREHYMLHLTSSVADVYLSDVTNQIQQGFVSVTRCDIQITIPKPKSWSQMEFFKAQYERSKVTWIDSKDKRSGKMLETVGIGSRTSDRYVRMYTKLGAGELYLRFEVEFKGDRAKAVMREILRRDEGKKEILLHELLKLKSKRAESAFYMAIGAHNPFRVKVQKLTSASKTNRWLVETVLPVLIRQLSDHDDDGSLWDAYHNELLRAGRMNGIDYLGGD